MKSIPDVVELAQKLVRYDTVGDNNERRVLEELADILQSAGFSCLFDEYDPQHADRASLCARLNPDASGPSLYLGGHIDTIPFGDAPWEHDPLSGDIVDGKLHGRGSSDMKGGVAAMICAAVASADNLRGKDLVLHIYGGEELGCLGSFHATRRPELFGNSGAGIIAEPSGNFPYAGHRGALWLAVETQGRTAHGSMPEQGVNALTALLPGAIRLAGTTLDATHPILGKSSMALTSLHSGMNPNSIPDKAVLTLDMRTVPGQSHEDLRSKISGLAGQEASVRTVLDLPPVWTEPDLPWCVAVRNRLANFLGKKPGVLGAPYFTDASAVRTLLQSLPLLILGPGDTTMAHKSNEHCKLEQIQTAFEIYKAIIADWY
jgi:succinyl-diaminopimelate desuccinylase